MWEGPRERTKAGQFQHITCRPNFMKRNESVWPQSTERRKYTRHKFGSFCPLFRLAFLLFSLFPIARHCLLFSSPSFTFPSFFSSLSLLYCVSVLLSLPFILFFPSYPFPFLPFLLLLSLNIFCSYSSSCLCLPRFSFYFLFFHSSSLPPLILFFLSFLSFFLSLSLSSYSLLSLPYSVSLFFFFHFIFTFFPIARHSLLFSSPLLLLSFLSLSSYFLFSLLSLVCLSSSFFLLFSLFLYPVFLSFSTCYLSLPFSLSLPVLSLLLPYDSLPPDFFSLVFPFSNKFSCLFLSAFACYVLFLFPDFLFLLPYPCLSIFILPFLCFFIHPLSSAPFSLCSLLF